MISKNPQQCYLGCEGEDVDCNPNTRKEEHVCTCMSKPSRSPEECVPS